MTLFEVMFALAISSMVLAGVCSLYFYSYRSFAAQLNYVEMDQDSHRALDKMSQQIRQVKAMTGFTTNQLTFTDYDDQTLSFIYNPTNKTLFRRKAGLSDVLLNGCDSLTFSIYQRNPVAGKYDQYPTADVTTAKLVQVQWLCSRKLFSNSQMNTESMQSAKIVIRQN
jgi:Tfp pilus assembly protein PilW